MKTDTTARSFLWGLLPGKLLCLLAAVLASPLSLVGATIAVTPASQDFGLVRIGLTADRSFTVENTDGGTLAGTATVAAPFSVVSGSPYNLGPHQSTTVVVRYSPTAEGASTQNVTFTGGGGGTRPVSGTGFIITHYVNRNGTNPVPPFLSWATAATGIQDAVDAALAGETVMVTNGVYDAGGRTGVGQGVINRAAIDVAITVQSVNGPAVTVIDGAGLFRCAYVGTNAVLNGFTLTNGYADFFGPDYGGGAAWCEASAVVTNCVLTASATYGAGSGGGVYGGMVFNSVISTNTAKTGAGACAATLYNCTLAGNSALRSAGGAYGGVLYNCTLAGNLGGEYGGGARAAKLYGCMLVGNRADDGGGALESELYDCTLTGNFGRGGGAASSTLSGCVLTGNTSWSGGGGASSGTLSNCVLMANHAGGSGGGAAGSSLYNCTLVANSTDSYGGGAHDGTLYNCTLVANSAGNGGGVGIATLNNCIVYNNTAVTAPNYDTASVLNYCCTTPLPPSGIGNIDQKPAFVNPAEGDYHLQAGSPCINTGLNQVWMTGATDLDGNPRISYGTVDMGAYEFFTPPTLPAKMLVPVWAPGNVQVRFTGVVGRTYSLQRATTLNGPWSTIASPTVNLVGIGSFDDPSPPAATTFYRSSYP